MSVQRRVCSLLSLDTSMLMVAYAVTSANLLSRCDSAHRLYLREWGSARARCPRTPPATVHFHVAVAGSGALTASASRGARRRLASVAASCTWANERVGRSSSHTPRPTVALRQDGSMSWQQLAKRRGLGGLARRHGSSLGAGFCTRARHRSRAPPSLGTPRWQSR